ncbi:MAG: hypothetical protein FJX83_06295 [Bacteroidetes bacterium]|nr:hypothetical protein [Bacteroidota bacterium]
MSTIREQSIRSSIFIYAGFAIGAFNVLFLFPRYFTPEQFGLTRVLLDIALIVSTLCAAGLLPVAMRFYPFYKHHLPKKQNDLFTWSMGAAGIFFLLMVLIFPWLQPWAMRKFGYRSPMLAHHLPLVLPLAASLITISVLEVFAWIVGRTAVANFLKEFLFRLLTLLLILAWISGTVVGFENFILFYSLLFVPSAALMAWVVWQSGEFSWSFRASKVTRRYGPIMTKYGIAYLASAVLNILAKTNDTLIIASQSQGGLADAAIFTIATYLITVMEVPQRSLVASASPAIAMAWKNNDVNKLERLYKKTALNLLIIALGILGVVLCCLPLLEQLLGKGYQGLTLLMIILGIGKLIDLGTGLNSQILQLSKHWKIDLLTNMGFVVLAIVLNYFLTKNYGIMGTAVGSVSSILAFNAVRFIYIKKIYGMQPFGTENIKAIALAVGIAVPLIFFIRIEHILAATLIKSLLFILTYSACIIRFKLSEDISSLYASLKAKF